MHGTIKNKPRYDIFLCYKCKATLFRGIVKEQWLMSNKDSKKAVAYERHGRRN